MKTILIAIILLSFFSLNCFGQSRRDSFYVFVGKRISITQFHPKVDSNHILMDAAFKAKYKVVQNVYGDFGKDTIEFDAYDHYGTPAFSKYPYVLLFVSNINGHLYHEKYQFFDVYKTKDGRWAAAYRARLYEENNSTTIKPEKIDFIRQVCYSLKGRTKEEIEELFPVPYYNIVGEKAIAAWGNYVEQLFQLERETVLKARGIF